MKTQRAGGTTGPETRLELPAIAAAATLAAATAVATTAAETPGTAICFRTRFVDIERAPVQILTVETVDRIIGFGIVRHFDERETTRLTRITIPDDVDIIHATVRLERRAECVFGGPEAEITDKNIFH